MLSRLFVIAASTTTTLAATLTHVSQLRAGGYDFIVAGGGTAGLTVGDRLSEAFPKQNVLVIEYGTVEYAPRIGGPPSNDVQPGAWAIKSLPNPGINNRSVSVTVGKVVGGSSCINGMFFDRGSRHDYDTWRKVGQPEFDTASDKWDWDGIIPFFKKSVTFTPPTKEQAALYGYTWDTALAYGGSGPINSTFPTFQWPAQRTGIQAWSEMGIRNATECAGGDKAGVCWVPNSKDPNTCERSHSGLGHYQNVMNSRQNYDLLVLHKVTRVLYEPGKEQAGPPRVEVRSLNSSETSVINAKAEVIISAGAVHTPQILQRSGIGPPNVLKAANIPLLIDLPGVGTNFQDHSGVSILSRANMTAIDGPSQLDLRSNATFRQQALEQYALRPAQGPYTVVGSSNAVYVGLPNITEDYAEIAAKVEKQLKDGSFASFLPPGSSDTVKEGYKAQLAVLANELRDWRSPVFESIIQGGPASSGYLLKPLSRGSVHLNASAPDGEPAILYGTAAHPADVAILSSFIPFLRRQLETPTFKALGASELYPGGNVTTATELEAYVRRTASGSFAHPCCTAPMMPRNKGGVVGPDLKVHGVQGLRVVDFSIAPLIPGTHTSATVYALAEKGADIIIRQWKAKGS